eukprot:c29914_g1_i1 orf=2-271(-)
MSFVQTQVHMQSHIYTITKPEESEHMFSIPLAVTGNGHVSPSKPFLDPIPFQGHFGFPRWPCHRKQQFPALRTYFPFLSLSLSRSLSLSL